MMQFRLANDSIKLVIQQSSFSSSLEDYLKCYLETTKSLDLGLMKSIFITFYDPFLFKGNCSSLFNKALSYALNPLTTERFLDVYSHLLMDHPDTDLAIMKVVDFIQSERILSTSSLKSYVIGLDKFTIELEVAGSKAKQSQAKVLEAAANASIERIAERMKRNKQDLIDCLEHLDECKSITMITNCAEFLKE